MRFLKQLIPFVAVVAVSLVGSLAVGAVGDLDALRLVLGLATAVAAVFAYRLTVRLVERRSVSEAAGRGAASALARGSLLGAAMFAGAIGGIALFGGVHAGSGSLAGAVGEFGFMAAAAVTEELMFRGVLFRIVEERLGTWISLALTAIAFGGMHLVNPGATLWGGIAIALEAGTMLAAAYVATRSLWLPIGIHFGWNFAEGGIFGADVSGNGTSTGLLHSTFSGPTWLTGGEFGPEASVLSIAVCLVIAAAFIVLAHRRGNIVPLRRSARAAALTRRTERDAAVA